MILSGVKIQVANQAFLRKTFMQKFFGTCIDYGIESAL